MSFIERQLETSQLRTDRLAVSQLEVDCAKTRAYCGICDHVVLSHFYNGKLCWFCLSCRQMVIASERRSEILQRSVLDHKSVCKLNCDLNNSDGAESDAFNHDGLICNDVSCDDVSRNDVSCDDVNLAPKLARNEQTHTAN